MNNKSRSNMNTNTLYNISNNKKRRLYKSRIRRQKMLLRKFVLAFVLFAIILIGGLSINSVKTNAKTDGDDLVFKYFTSVEVTKGQTVSEIAHLYYNDDFQSSFSDYLKEIKATNHLTNDYQIKAGQVLIIPYFSAEYK